MFSAKSNTPVNRDYNKKLVKLIHNLLTMEESVSFRKPVAHKALGLDDYRTIVKKPTDLNLIRRQNNEGKYKIVQEVLDEIQLCWNNCKIYNSTDSEIYKEAEVMEAAFDKMGMQLLPEMWNGIDREQINKAERQKKSQEDKKRVAQNIKNSNKKEKLTSEIKEDPNRAKSRIFQNFTKNSDLQELNVKVVIEEKPKKVSFVKSDQMEIEKNQEDANQINSHEENQMDIQEPAEPTLQPIMVNLLETPNRQQLLEISQQLKGLYQSSQFAQMEKILEVLHTNEKQHMTITKNGMMTFNMQKIHISTYFRIRKILNLNEEGVILIE